MIGGTFLPAMVLYFGAKSFKANDSIVNIVTIAGLIYGGMVTAKMLKDANNN